jgi:hypothetical protein
MDHLYDCGKWEKRSSSPSNEPLLPFPLQAHQLAQSPHTHPNAPPMDQLLDLLGTDLLEVYITYFNLNFAISEMPTILRGNQNTLFIFQRTSGALAPFFCHEKRKTAAKANNTIIL